MPTRNLMKRPTGNPNCGDIKLHNFANYADYDSSTRFLSSGQDQWSQMNFVVDSEIQEEYHHQEHNQTVFINEINESTASPESRHARPQFTRFSHNDVELLRYGNFNPRVLYSNLPRARLSNHYFNGHLSRRLSSSDLTDADIDRVLERDTTFHLPTSIMTARPEYGSTSSMSLLERYRRFYEESDDRDENYLKLYQSLSRLDRFMPKEKYVPGKVHYEREYRIYGRDTVALIYYKTCYL